MNTQKATSIAAVICLSIIALCLGALTASAAPQSWPNGPWIVPEQEESSSAIRTYDQLVATLENIVKSSQDAAALAYAPYPAKGSGRLVPYVRIGDGAA